MSTSRIPGKIASEPRLALALATLTLAFSQASADSEGGGKNGVSNLSTVTRVATRYDAQFDKGFPLADKVVVRKADRKLQLMKDDEAFRTFDIALGIAPYGHKEEEGDNRTPEGVYWLDMRNPHSDYFLSIRISYPDESDRRLARQKGVEPGGQIMIHGQPNKPTYSAAYYRQADWTNGCIAVSNSDMIDIWLMTPNRVPIEILP